MSTAPPEDTPIDAEMAVAPTEEDTAVTTAQLEEGFKRAERYKTVMGSVAKQYICLITKEPPFDPVTADDGRTYERWAIEECIERQGEDLKSPATNLPMGPRLTSAVQAHNSIRKLIESGAIEGDLANQWNQRIKEEKVKVTKKKANDDADTDAMCDLGDWHYFGKNGILKDKKQAYQW